LQSEQDKEKDGMMINHITNSKVLVKSAFILSICILLILAIPNIKNGIYCETDQKIPPDLTLVYSSDMNGYYKPCG
jgi:hypothetical protein